VIDYAFVSPLALVSYRILALLATTGGFDLRFGVESFLRGFDNLYLCILDTYLICASLIIFLLYRRFPHILYKENISLIFFFQIPPMYEPNEKEQICNILLDSSAFALCKIPPLML